MNKIKFNGRILFLTKDPHLIRKQIRDKKIQFSPDLELMDNISTDEITPGWVCFFHDEILGKYVYAGLRNKSIPHGSILSGGFEVVVSGVSKGCGSSREMAPYAEKYAGIRLVIAKTVEKIYRQNCENIGLFVSTDFSLIDLIQSGKEIEPEIFTKDRDQVSKDIIMLGGLSNYNLERIKGKISVPEIHAEKRPMNIVEKIIASHSVTPCLYVSPYDPVFVRTDVRFVHDYTASMTHHIFRKNFGNAEMTEKESILFFRDHLCMLHSITENMSDDLFVQAGKIYSECRDIAEKAKIRLIEHSGNPEGICHIYILQNIALPGQIIAGTDSHTSTAGALGALAFGVGSTDMANAWFTGDVRVSVPEAILVNLTGKLKPWVTAKDVMLEILAREDVRRGDFIGKAVVFSGSSLKHIGIDERATMTNMAVEAGAFTGICEPDDVALKYLKRLRKISDSELRRLMVRSDKNAGFSREITMDLSGTVPMAALPSDPRTGIPVSEISGNIFIDIAYGGSCTGSKMQDMDQYASIVKKALNMGLKCHESVKFFIQFGSLLVKDYCRKKGYLRLFRDFGARLIDPGCGACINAGPGISEDSDQVTISAINRNYPGRSGPGRMYLGSPLTVASSAVRGRITSPEEFFPG